MKASIISFISGQLFGTGLVLGEMTRPDRVVGFLNIFGDWDPSLAYVMGGAVITHSLAYLFIKRRNQPIVGTSWSLPARKKVTPSLVVGSVIFGVGWGLGGYCPGPGIVALSSLQIKPFVFVGFMSIGMLISRALASRSLLDG